MAEKIESLTMGIPEFASLAGISRNQAYALAANNLLGVRIIRFGKRLVIPRRAAMTLSFFDGRFSKFTNFHVLLVFTRSNQE